MDDTTDTLFNELCSKSEDFTDKYTNFKTISNRIYEIGKESTEKKKKIVEHAKDTKIILHANVRDLIRNFVETKKHFGTKMEKEVYKDMDVNKMIERLIMKRALAFFGNNDYTLLLNGVQPDPSHWSRVGTDNEGDIKIKDNLTYDEIALSALIGVAVPTFFINPGGRYNIGHVASPRESEGVYVALTGARFERRDQMESKHMLVLEDHTPEKGYGNDGDPTNPNTEILKTWFQFYKNIYEFFYGKKFPFPELQNFPAYGDMEKCKVDGNFFHYHPRSNPPLYIIVPFYKARLRLILEPFLLEANERAKVANKRAYIHAVGLGLGVWQISTEQANWMLEVYHEIIADNVLEFVSDIDFSWFGDPEKSKCGNAGNGEFITDNKNKIKIRFSKRDPAQKLDDDSKLLIAAYAWDGNSFPGNEYWLNMLHASGDPAAACCSTITELQNPYINNFVTNIKYWSRM